MEFSKQYGPWALVAGASEGVGKLFAQELARLGLNVVLIARRQAILETLSLDIERRYGVESKVLAVDLASENAVKKVLAAVEGIEVGFFVYCAGADADFAPFLDVPLTQAESMIQRNCLLPVQLCYEICKPMTERAKGAVVLVGSGAGFAGSQNMAAYSASKAFDMVFAEALYCELKPRGVDVLGLILGETDTPALRRLRFKLGLAATENEAVKGAESPENVVKDCLLNLRNGPTRLANRKMRWGLKFLYPFSRNFVVGLMSKANQKVMGGA